MKIYDKLPCLFPMNNGSRCCECITCQPSLEEKDFLERLRIISMGEMYRKKDEPADIIAQYICNKIIFMLIQKTGKGLS